MANVKTLLTIRAEDGEREVVVFDELAEAQRQRPELESHLGMTFMIIPFPNRDECNGWAYEVL